MSSTQFPVDPRLPHLGLALDGADMRSVFARQRGLDPEWQVLRCAVERVKYRPRRNLAVTYRLTLRHGRQGRELEQFVATRWCAGGESLRRHADARSETLAPTAAGPTVTHDPALDLVAHWWPHDAKLKRAAAALGDTRAMRERWLPEIARLLAAPSATLADATVRLVQLVPEQRVTARAELRLADGSTHAVFAKGDAEQRGPATQAAMQALWDSPARRHGELVVPQPLGWQAGSGLHWQRAVAGQALLDADATLVHASAGRVGALLAALHDTPVELIRSEYAAPKCERLHELVDTLSLIEPGWAPSLQRLAHRLEPALPTLFNAPPVTLHGDLHPRNVLLAADGRLALIDLDGLRRGPALLDLAAWCADGLYRGMLSGQPAEVTVASLREFMRGYRRASGFAPTESDWAGATAWQLLNQRAWRCAVNLKPGRYTLVRPLIETALVLLAAGSLNAAGHARKVAA